MTVETPLESPEYPFIRTAGRILNSGQTRVIALTGNILDLFYSGTDDAYLPLQDVLIRQWSVAGSIVVVYELNGPIRFVNPSDARKMREAWGRLYGHESNQQAIDLALARTRKRLEELSKKTDTAFDECLARAQNNPTYALEMLRQMCLCSRMSVGGEPCLWEDLVILIEGADILIPEGEIARLGDMDRQRVAICRDWFSDPGFLGGRDSVVLLAESSSLLNSRIARLPQLLQVEIPAPDEARRLALIRWFQKSLPAEKPLQLWSGPEALAQLSAGLSVHALLQLLRQGAHSGSPLQPADVIAKVEAYMQALLGEDVIEFKKPAHRLEDVVGFTKLKEFIRSEFMPRLRAGGKTALSGAAIGGPIGSGKTFLLEAVAGELGIVVLVLKNIRSKWFGETDVLFERLRRTICALDKSLIFVDEADTQFGGVGSDTHETEKRLTGKIQAMMSDPLLRGKTAWLLITARIHLLSPDLRRPGRAGSLIVPILDPEGDDADAFIAWMIRPVFQASEACPAIENAVALIRPETAGYYAAAFSEIRADLQAAAAVRGKKKLELSEIMDVLRDHIPPAVEKTRRYQTLQALLNCTRRTLLPGPPARDQVNALRDAWRQELRHLEAQGES